MSDSRAASLRALLFASSAAGMLVAAPAFAADVTAESVTARAVTYTENTPVRATRASFASAGALSRYKLGPRP